MKDLNHFSRWLTKSVGCCIQCPSVTAATFTKAAMENWEDDTGDSSRPVSVRCDYRVRLVLQNSSFSICLNWEKKNSTKLSHFYINFITKSCRHRGHLPSTSEPISQATGKKREKRKTRENCCGHEK